MSVVVSFFDSSGSDFKTWTFSLFCVFHLLSHHNSYLSVAPMHNNAFNIIPFTYNSNADRWFVNRNNSKHFLECFKTAYDVNLFQNKIRFRWFNSSFKLWNSLSTFVKMADFQGIKDSSDMFLSDNNFPKPRLV